jgi:pantoate--beta-alanine ligase
MLCFDRIQPMREQVSAWRKQGRSIALVPTMGNLHAGHLALVKKAIQIADHTIATIFVNPTQFVQGEDYASYPRTFDDDRMVLESAGTDVLLHPDVHEMYPDGPAQQTQVVVSGLDDILCGKFRPGHFSGVATVVTKLLHITTPDVALFGEKDYQQLLVIQRLVRDLDMPVTIVGIPTVREKDGLALSSRNQYLSEMERRTAPILYKTLSGISEEIKKGRTDYAAMEHGALARLTQAGFRPEYFSIRRASDLDEAGVGRNLVVLAAAWLGKARLIDNVLVGR